MLPLALLLVGFSLFSALVLALTHFRAENYQGQGMSRIMGLVLLAALGGLQLAHFAWLYLGEPWVSSAPYRMTLFAVAPAFFVFSRPLIGVQEQSQRRWQLAWHAAPVLAAPLFPNDVALPLAFAVGAGYLLWLARRLYDLRRERDSFQREMATLGGVFVIALGVSALGLVHASLPGKLFFSLYAISIGLAFFLVQTTLGLRPQLSAEVAAVADSVRTSYANSTLTNIDCDAALSRLEGMMSGERLYEDSELSLPSLAERLDLSTHQLSELMNARLGKSFSRYLRERRVAAAKSMLCDEPSASVLSVGLSVGFTSQSNFYEAFREIEGMTPGQFRKLSVGTSKSS